MPVKERTAPQDPTPVRPAVAGRPGKGLIGSGDCSSPENQSEASATPAKGSTTDKGPSSPPATAGASHTTQGTGKVTSRVADPTLNPALSLPKTAQSKDNKPAAQRKPTSSPDESFPPLSPEHGLRLHTAALEEELASAQAEAAATKKRADAEKREREELQSRILREQHEYGTRARQEEAERAVRDGVHKTEPLPIRPLPGRPATAGRTGVGS